MKTVNHVNRKRRRWLPAVVTLLVLGGIVVLIGMGMNRLKAIWQAQCVITDYNRQVTITSGKMVKAGVIAESLGLKNGANLALIDFAGKREEILKRIPNLKDLRIERILPDRVKIVTEERRSIARLSVHGRKTPTGKVVDAEGVVFLWNRGTRTLPTIFEPSAPGTAIGQRLTGRIRAALMLIDVCRSRAEFMDLGLLEVDAYKPEFLQATLSETYSTVKIAWEEMDEATPASRASLIRQLTMLTKAIRSRVGDGAVIWNATDTSKPGRIYADLKGNLK